MDATSPTNSKGARLPLGLQVRRFGLVALLLLVWGPVKLAWESRIAHDQDVLRYGGARVTLTLRDKISQGLTLGVLSGLRGVVADFVWLTIIPAWMDQDWWKVAPIVETSTALQPRFPTFWDMGGWYLAWNASMAEKYNFRIPDEMRRLKAQQFWIERGRDILLRGIENNPFNWRLWQDAGWLYNERLHDYPKAAYYYQRASELPGAPIFLERFPARMYDKGHGNVPEQEYAEWVKLWKKLTPEEKANPQHDAKEIVGNIRQLEQRLNVPNEKRIFPN